MECLKDEDLRRVLEESVTKSAIDSMQKVGYPEDEEEEVLQRVSGFVDLCAISMACSKRPYEVNAEVIHKAEEYSVHHDHDHSARIQAASECKNWLEKEFVSSLNRRPFPELDVLPGLPDIMEACFPKGEHYEAVETRFFDLPPARNKKLFKRWKKDGRSDRIAGEFTEISPEKGKGFVVPIEGAQIVKSMFRLVGVYRTSVFLASSACEEMMKNGQIRWKEATAEYFSRKKSGEYLGALFWTFVQSRWIVKLAFSSARSSS